MARGRTKLAVVGLLGLAMLTLGGGAAEAVPGGGGRNIDARMRGKTLVLRGARGKVVGVAITPVRGGVRLTSSSRLNNREGPLVLKGRPRHVKVDYGRSLWGDFAVLPPAEGVAPMRLGGVTVRGARQTSRIYIEGARIDRFVRVRAAHDRHMELTVIDSQVFGDLRTRLGSGASTQLEVRDSTVEGRIDVTMRGKALPSESVGGFDVIDSTIRRIDVQPRLSGRIQRSDVSEDVVLELTPYVRLEDSIIRGRLAVLDTRRGDVDEFAFVHVRDTTIEGETTIACGDGADDIELVRATFASLDLRAGAGDDVVHSTSLSVATQVAFDGGAGDADLWETDDTDAVEARSFEETQLVPTD